MVGNYLQAIHYFDQELGEFLGWMRSSGLLDRSVLVIYGDHQAFLGGQAELPRPARLRHLGRVSPLSGGQADPGHDPTARAAQAAGTWTTTSSHLDVAPTVLGLLGIEDRSTVMLGRDLSRRGQPLAVFRDGSFADESHYFVNQFGRTVASHCYEAATAEPIDCEPLAALQREARDRLEISDTIVQSNLIPVLTPEAAACPLTDANAVRSW